jgi:hypothetical protein
MSNVVMPPKKHYGHLWIQNVYEFGKFAKRDNEIDLHHHHQQLWKSFSILKKKNWFPSSIL